MALRRYNPTTPGRRGLVLVELENVKLALQSFEAAIEIHPKLPGANLNAEALRRQIEKNEI